MGMALTMVGLYGLVSYAVTRRTREIGIRMAIGATQGSVVRMVLRQCMLPVWVGVPLGLAPSLVPSSALMSTVPTGHRITGSIYWLVVPLLVAVTTLAPLCPRITPPG